MIDQSLHARQGVETTNGDGFGIGWHGIGETPGRYRSVTPAWSDANLRDLAAHIESPLFLAHIRATTGTPVQQTNCHDGIAGSTDSETLFYLALTFGLEDAPLDAVERAVGFIEATARAHGVEQPVQMTLGFSDGVRLWAVRYSSAHQSRALYVSADVETVKALHPENPRFHGLTEETRVVVSEPLSDLPGVWVEVPESTALIIQPGADEQLAFRPQMPVEAETPSLR